MGREPLLRAVEATPGVLLFALGVLCLVCVVTDTHDLSMTILGFGGSLLLALLGVVHVRLVCCGELRFLIRGRSPDESEPPPP